MLCETFPTMLHLTITGRRRCRRKRQVLSLGQTRDCHDEQSQKWEGENVHSPHFRTIFEARKWWKNLTNEKEAEKILEKCVSVCVFEGCVIFIRREQRTQMKKGVVVVPWRLSEISTKQRVSLNTRHRVSTRLATR